MDFRKKGTDKEIYDVYKEKVSSGRYSSYLEEKSNYLMKKGLYRLFESNEDEKGSF